MNCAPIAIFAFNRPNYLKRLLHSLSENRPMLKNSKVYFFIDGPRTESESQEISKVCEIAKNYVGPKQTKIISRTFNLGLSKSIISGIDYVFSAHSTIIVLEDDLIVGPEFLRYCNKSLDFYQNNNEVASIQGFSNRINLPEQDAYFQLGADCWGWATWKNRWLEIEWDSNKLLTCFTNNKKSYKKFNYNGAFPYTQMLRREARGEVDSWAIRWHASMFLQGKLSLYPTQTLVKNLGRDGSGTHPGILNEKTQIDFGPAPNLQSIPIVDSKYARKQLEKIYRRQNRIFPSYSPKKYFYFVKRNLLE